LRIIFFAASALAICAIAAPAAGQQPQLPAISTNFQFTRQDSTDDESARTTAVLGLTLSHRFQFSQPGFAGEFTTKYQGNVLMEEFVRSDTAEARTDQRYQVDFAMGTPGGMSLAAEFATRDRYFRRDRFDSILSKDTWQKFQSGFTITRQPYPSLSAQVSTERNVGIKGAPLTSSQLNNAAVSGAWDAGPVKLTLSRVRLESKSDPISGQPGSSIAGDQTVVGSTGAYPLGGAWTLSHAFVYTEDVRSIAGRTDKSMATNAQLRLEGKDIAPGLSAAVVLGGQNNVLANIEANNRSFNQKVNLAFAPPGEIIGDDRLSFGLENSDVDSAGRSTNIRRYILSWSFAPAPGSNVLVSYNDQTNSDLDLRRLNERQSNYTVRYSYARDNYTMDGAYTFSVVEGRDGQESRTNNLNAQVRYKVSEPLELNGRIEQWENRNIPANPTFSVNSGRRFEWALGLNWRPSRELSMNAGYQRQTLDNSAGGDTEKRILRLGLRWRIAANMDFSLDYSTDDFSRIGELDGDKSNSTLQTTLNVTF
jgi:hypothetical protein